MREKRANVLTGFVVSLLPQIAGAGDLNPPPGPVAPSMKPLDVVEPRTPIGAETTPGDANSQFKIAQPGSYYLTSDVAGVVGRHGIEIGASDVSIDLMGFSLRGVPGSLDGISRDSATVTNIRIFGGNIRTWGGDGVDLSAGSNHSIRDVHVIANMGSGIRCHASSIIESCTSSLNGAVGIQCLGVNPVVRSCASYLNGDSGVQLFSNGAVANIAVYQNGGAGIITGDVALISDCSVRLNSGSGISVGSGSTVSDCASANNGMEGILAGSGSTIVNCSTTGNTGDGIEVFGDCSVLNNTCDGNGQSAGDGAGIHVNAAGADNRIEGNNCTDNDRGIDVDSAGNLIVRNTCSGNTTNWDIVANNVVGPVLDRGAPASAAILGNSAPDSTGSTHPNANFTY